MNTIVVKPFGSAPGFTSEPFPMMKPLVIVRSAFSRAADDKDQRRRASNPMVYALPLEGIIAHGEEGASFDAFQNPNEKIRAVFSESASRNNFRDLNFTVKPSSATAENGSPKAYLLKIKLPGGGRSEWRQFPDKSVSVYLAHQEARSDAASAASQIVVLHVGLDTAAKTMDEGFGDFVAKPARKDAPHVLTFEVPSYIDYESLLSNETPAAFPKGLVSLDRVNGFLNIVLPVKEEGGFTPARVGLGQRAPV